MGFPPGIDAPDPTGIREYLFLIIAAVLFIILLARYFSFFKWVLFIPTTAIPKKISIQKFFI